MENYGTKEFATKKELFQFIVTNKDTLIAQKKAIQKEVDCSVIIPTTIVWEKNIVVQKAEGQIIDPISLDKLEVVVVINTTNFMDNHDDVHIPSLWNKSLNENKMIMHLQEHDMEFEKIIADGIDLKVYTKRFDWSELGYTYNGTTEALIFDSTIWKKRNPFMLVQYANGWVKNHSVSMRYVKIDFAINDESFPNEYEAWKKYYPMIANYERADERGFFCYVLEAKCIEGSAVPLGSNTCTPTLSNGMNNVKCDGCGNVFDYNSVPEKGMGYVECPECKKEVTQGMKHEPLKNTRKHNEPDLSTHKAIDYNFLTHGIKNLKF